VAAEVLRLAHENVTPDMIFPFWSKPVALNWVVVVAGTVTDAGDTVIDVRTGGGGVALIVSVAGALVTPDAEATIVTLPAALPVATPV
jgi:hypothetical protein